MTAVCGICVSNAVEENCYILMPGCGHVFDKACIINSLGVEYTCPECKNNYLLPSPYRPFQLANSTDFVEYKEIHKHLMRVNQTITKLKEELAKAHEDLNVEQRSRMKSNESLITLNKKFVALQEKYSSLKPKETGDLVVAAASQEEVYINASQTPSKIQVTSSPRTPVPAETTKACEEGAAHQKPDDTKEKLLIHYNNRIHELKAKLPHAQGYQQQPFKEHFRFILKNMAMLEKFHNLRSISGKVAANISYLQANADRNAVKHKNIISNLSASIKKAKEMDDASVAEKQDSIKVYVDKISELEKASKLSGLYNLQALNTTYQEYDALLPNTNQMCYFSTAPKKLKQIKAKHAKLNSINLAIKRAKLQEKLEHTLTLSKRFRERIDLHTTVIEQAKQMNRELETLLGE